MEVCIDLVAGTAGGAAGVLIEYPFDTVKVLLQSYGKSVYTGYWDCIRKEFAHDGIFGFYRGMSARLVASGFEHACIFISYKWVLRAIGADEKNPHLWHIAVGGCGAGVASMVSLTPFDLVKCRLQADNTSGKRLYRNSWDCARKVYNTGGLKGLYKGGVPMLIREIPGTVAWCGTYDILKMRMTPEGGDSTKDLALWKRMFAGGCSGVAFWTVVYPADVVKTRVQVDPAYSRYTFMRALREQYKEGGIRALYRGYSLTAIRSFPSNAAIFCVYDMCALSLARGLGES